MAWASFTANVRLPMPAGPAKRKLLASRPLPSAGETARQPVVSFNAVPAHERYQRLPSLRGKAILCDGRGADVGLHFLDRPRGVDDHDLGWVAGGLGEKALADAGVKLGALLLHAIRPADPRGGRLGRHVQQQRQLRAQPAGGQAAHGPRVSTSRPPP